MGTIIATVASVVAAVASIGLAVYGTVRSEQMYAESATTAAKASQTANKQFEGSMQLAKDQAAEQMEYYENQRKISHYKKFGGGKRS